MNKKGFSEIDLLESIKIIFSIILVFVLYQSIKEQFGILGVLIVGTFILILVTIILIIILITQNGNKGGIKI